MKEIIVTKPMRKELPKERPALIHKIEIANFEGYMSVGLYDDGMPAEIFITASKEGSTISGLLDAFAIQTSLALQYGVPLEVMIDKMTNSKFEPAGFTKHPDIKIASSIIDYIFKWMQLKFIDNKVEVAKPKHVDYTALVKANALAQESLHLADTLISTAADKYGISFTNGYTNGNGKVHHTGEICTQCGSMMIRTGTCLTCTCGNSLGGCGA